ncbi:MAG: hypothetical protein NZ903_01985 [Candidatus Micrarchaeota archaeon]|nr:hypothetical protein [Candidatus Micrarchaeota archaeon]
MASQSEMREYGMQKFNIKGFWLAIFLCLLSISYAQGGQSSERLKTTLCALYKDLNSIIPTVAFVLFVLAGVAYAGGQFFGAETRARAISWSMSMVTGAVIGLLIVQVASVLISNLSGYRVEQICPV